MKVLFAVNDENISTSIVKKYQKNYKEIISYKNVYYFNAILKELQRNKSYDRIVISEDLEEFTSSSYAQKDKFIFDRLDNISDEAVTSEGVDIPIILICSERRKKSEEILVKLFGIGVYNAIIGDDRSTDEVCRLINKPRAKKDAKVYYAIDTEKVSYERENDVSEMEMQNILLHFKRLGNNFEKYEKSFNNISSQYNENQMKIIVAVLPDNVKDILSEYSKEYRRLAGIRKDTRVSSETKTKRSNGRTISSKKGTVEKLLDIDENKMRLTRPVVVPTTMEKNLYKKLTPKPNLGIDLDELEEEPIENIIDQKPKKRGRPRKTTQEEQVVDTEKPKKRGRPKKEKNIEIEEQEKNEFDNIKELEDNTKDYDNENITVLPGIDDEDNEFDALPEPFLTNTDISKTPLLGYDEKEYDNEYLNRTNIESQNNYSSNYNQSATEYDNIFDDGEFERLLTADKKVVAFVGTSKNGTSFIVNNVAEILSSMGVNTAIFDATQNKNAYYIYTKNDEDLRRVAANSLENLKNNIAEGIKVNNNLTVYTNIPNQNEEMKNSRPILETIAKNHTVVLIDSDFDTPIEYFSNAQELYLVQSMDVLTIQPLTAFLRELKMKNALDERKIRIVLNKILRIRGVSGKNIVDGMSNYNDPEMSFMTELFDRNLVKIAGQIPFDEDVYARYLENLVQCDMRIKGYPKEFKQRLNSLANNVFNMSSNKELGKRKINNQKDGYSKSFSPGMNSTLDSMRKKY